MDYKNLIEKRQSCRDFTNKEIEQSSIKIIKEFFNSSLKFDNEEILLEAFPYAGKKLEGAIGYHGFALSAPMYLVLMGKKKNTSYIKAGFRGMNLILKLLDMGIHTCFLTVNDSEKTKKALGIKNELEILSVIACGYAKEVKDLVRLDIKSPSDVEFISRKGYFAPKISLTEMVYVNEWGNKLEITDRFPGHILEESLYAASLAPYFFNKQEFRYILKDHKLILCNKNDELVSCEDRLIGMGATMFNFFIIYNRFNKKACMWTLDTTDIKIKIPNDYQLIAYMNI